MRDLVERYMRSHGMLGPGAPVWVAVSGGLDSMVALHLLDGLGHPCHVLHVEHGIRGEESEADARFVEEWCHDHGIPVRVVRVDVRAYKAEHGGSTQMAARALRYDAFRAAVAEGPSVLALAHHADDAVETFLLHLMRGMGTKGWRSIAPRNGPFIRPLLDVRREALAAYAREHGIPFREDGSNRDTRYLRNAIRHTLMPLFEAMRPGAGEVMVRNMRIFREMQSAAEARSDEVLRGVMPDAEGTLRIPVERILASGVPRSLLTHLLRDLGMHPGRMEDILRAMEEGATGACFPSGDRSVLVDRGDLVIAPRKEVHGVWDIATPDAVQEGLPLCITPCTWAQVDLSEGLGVAWFDADLLRFPLELRPWRAGDRMRPSGMEGTRKISDMLVDAKVPRDRKGQVYVLVSGGRIVWLCGMRIAEEARATPASGLVWRVDWKGDRHRPV